MTCLVYDSVVFGIKQPLIGSFTIPIGDLIDELKIQRQNEINEVKKVIELIDNKIKGQFQISNN